MMIENNNGIVIGSMNCWVSASLSTALSAEAAGAAGPDGGLHCAGPGRRGGEGPGGERRGNLPGCAGRPLGEQVRGVRGGERRGEGLPGWAVSSGRRRE